MSRLRIPLSFVDVVALVGLGLLALGVGYRFGADLGIAVVGALLLLYAIFASRSEAAP